MTSQISAVFGGVRRVSVGFLNEKGDGIFSRFVLNKSFREVGNCNYWSWHELFVQFHEILFMLKMKSTPEFNKF